MATTKEPRSVTSGTLQANVKGDKNDNRKSILQLRLYQLPTTSFQLPSIPHLKSWLTSSFPSTHCQYPVAQRQEKKQSEMDRTGPGFEAIVGTPFRNATTKLDALYGCCQNGFDFCGSMTARSTSNMESFHRVVENQSIGLWTT
ncbi:hypothetical protein IV203_009567 [Nitzschia inconspicua]|uniref:Uncharacterized protein n=1 Tax=Nitzschia inconspicua TaxID=303405 RepID=A0A9K3KUY0_9STRA|nr:hypothetical protein IV203_009567 [Nitzschia inconspicua]